MSLEEHKRRERAQAIGLFRYQLICPALEAGLSTRQRGRVVREIAGRRHIDPFGTQVQIARPTLDRWIRRYRAGGFEALVPEPRRLATRTDAQVLELAASLKRENPSRTAAQVARILRTATGWAPSESTLLRHFHRCELMGPTAGASGEVFGRFEAADPNELWVGDALHGPRVGDRKTYLFAFLDDHSRLVVGHRFGFAEDTVRLAAALKPALAARGVPAGIYVDNGSAFVDAWLLRACAKLGIRLVHSAPGRPQGRGKIERFFRTVREQFLIEVTDTTAEDLAAAGVDHAAALLELNRLFTAWVETEYHRRTHSETGQAPPRRCRRLHRPQRQGKSIPKPEIRYRPGPPRHGRLHGPSRGRRGQRRHAELLLAAAEERPEPPALKHPRGTPHRDRHLDRTHLPPPPPGRPRTVDPHRIRSNHDHTGPSGRVTSRVTCSCSRPN